MAGTLTFIENKLSRSTVSGRNPKATLIWKAYREEDEAIVRNAFLNGTAGPPAVPAVAPITYEGLLLMQASVDPKGAGVWECRAEYGMGERQSANDPNAGGSGGSNSNDSHQPQPSDPMGPESSFDTTGGTRHISQSIRTVDQAIRTTPPDARGIPNTSRAIGVHGPDVDGVDVPVAVFKWTETWTFPAQAVTWAYAQRLKQMTGKSNAAAFRGAGPEEVVFLGATGAPNGQTKYRVTYSFSAEENREGPYDEETDSGGIVIAEGFPPVSKRGQHYLWVMYEEGLQTGYIGSQPRAVFVEQVLRVDDFKKLGIGT